MEMRHSLEDAGFGEETFSSMQYSERIETGTQAGDRMEARYAVSDFNRVPKPGRSSSSDPSRVALVVLSQQRIMSFGNHGEYGTGPASANID
jgi:hypothetical protein